MVRRSIRRFLASAAVDAVVRVTVVVGMVVGGYGALHSNEVGRENKALTECVANYNNANNARSVALTDAADEERKAERLADDAQAALFLSPILSKPAAQRTPVEQAEVLRLFRAYQEALTEQTRERAAADGARRDHPIPDPPQEVCD